MTKVKLFSVIVFAVVFVLSACNLPVPLQAKEATSTVLMISVSVATEYRTGPGQAYTVVGVLNPGQQVEAVGRSPNGDYLLIRDPANPADLWWLKSDHATVNLNPVGLPISTAPSTPTPVSNCPTPIGGGPTPVGGCPSISDNGCPTPVGGGPTPVNCPTSVGGPASVDGCPTPIGGGPTPVTCPTLVSGPTPVGDNPTPVGGPTPVNGPTKVHGPTPVKGPSPVPTPVK